jgi:hypothetical protein
VDGLDEYDGDHLELVQVLGVIAKSSHIKICVSSQPWIDFIDAFEGQKWKLRIQDLTVNDILIYIRDHLEKDLRVRTLKAHDTQAAQSLVDEIQQKAQGVFLWVFLVVRSLLKGLRNVHGISDLRRRLQELPGELEQYFEHMLNSVEKVYQQKTARVFKIMVAAGSRLPIFAFHVLDWVELLGPSIVLDMPPDPITIFAPEKIAKRKEASATSSVRRSPLGFTQRKRKIFTLPYC